MTQLFPWFERGFEFDASGIELHPNLRARLAGAPARLAELMDGVPAGVLTQRVAGKWSIQENAGHLFDLEGLWHRRLDDYDAGARELTPADLTNATTEAARHNDRPVAVVVEDFRGARAATVARLDAMTDRDFARVALHPRLQQPMRLFDLLVFVAEHDDHHLARVRELRHALTGAW